jgi:predicted DCC family thiol-disulfide oxidoreductase YuxK
MVDKLSDQEVFLVYDPQCPACKFYCQHARLDSGRLRHVDARQASETMEEITRHGLDIDQGMVLKKDGVLYYASDAIHELAVLAPRRGAFSRLNRVLFAHRRLATLLYPPLRACRNLLLKVLRKTKINNLGTPNNERF